MNKPIDTPVAALDHAQIRTVLLGVMLAMLLGALDQTIVATALPTIGRDLNNVQSLAWVVTAYLLTATAVTPLYGKLSDIYGRRTMLLIAIALFLGGSVACALSRNIYVLVAARAFQGLGGGGLISLAQTIVGDVVAPRERGRYQAYFASVFVTSSIAGPVLGGFFAEHLHWSFIFWINLPLGLTAYALTNRVLKMLPRHERPHRLDLIGAALMVVATVALLLALTWGGTTHPWGSPEIITQFAGSAFAWVLLGLWLVRAPEPFIPLTVLGNGVVRNGVISTFFAVGSMVGLAVYLPLYFEAVIGLTAAQSGVSLVAFLGGTVTGATIAGRIMVHYRNYKRSAIVGLALGTLMMLPLVLWPTSLNFITVEIILALAGIGIGTIFPITTTSVQNAVPPHQMGTATGVLNFFRSLGGAIVVAVFGAIFLGAVSSGSGTASIEQVVLQGGGNGTDFASIFRGVFIAAMFCHFAALVFILMMEQLPLRGRAAPAAEAAV